MLRRFELKNFKLFDERGVAIEPGRITVLIGANGTGKSSVLQALLLLKQSLGMNALETSGPRLTLGTYQDVVYRRQTERAMTVDLSASYKGFAVGQQLETPIAAAGTFDYRTVLTPEVTEQSGSVGGKEGPRLATQWRAGGPTVVEAVLQAAGLSISVSPRGQIGSPFSLSINAMAKGAEAQEAQADFMSLLTSFPRLLECYFMLPAIRGFDRISYSVSASEHLPEDLTAAGGPDEQAALTTRLIARYPELADEVAERLSRVLRREVRLRQRVTGDHLSGETAGEDGSINLLHEAFGLNQLVAPLLWLGRTPRGAIIGIEEPEIHLHPRAQAALCDLFVEVANEEEKQLILTTHSEHILMGFLTAVAQGRLKPEELAVYEFRREGNAARADRLEVNEYGQIEGGLQGFMEVGIDQVGELIAARFREG